MTMLVNQPQTNHSKKGLFLRLKAHRTTLVRKVGSNMAQSHKNSARDKEQFFLAICSSCCASNLMANLFSNNYIIHNSMGITNCTLSILSIHYI